MVRIFFFEDANLINVFDLFYRYKTIQSYVTRTR